MAAISKVIMTTPGGLDLALQQFKDKRKLALGDAYGEIGFYLQDVDGAYKRALDAGATSRVAPGGGGGLRVAIVLDPEGQPIELLRRPEAPPRSAEPGRAPGHHRRHRGGRSCRRG